MKTNIPLIEYNQIIQTKSSAKTIVLLLNNAEEKYLKERKNWHWNQKRPYPFWKICQNCHKPFSTHTKEQALRNKYCSKCVPKVIGQKNSGKKQKKQKCPICQKEFYPNGQSKKRPRIYCSRHCSGKAKDWLKLYSANGKGKKRPGTGLKGEKNPAWKGGTTYFRKKGNYGKYKIKYVRCPKEYLDMVRKDGYVMEHRLLVAQKLGRCLNRQEVVHHKDHNPENNTIENLMLFRNNREHKIYEAQEQR